MRNDQRERLADVIAQDEVRLDELLRRRAAGDRGYKRQIAHLRRSIEEGRELLETVDHGRETR